jgi:predicted aspartyl protease
LFAALPVALAGSLREVLRGSAASVSYRAKDPSHREAQKAMRAGKYEKAAQVYESLVAINASDLKARLGASFAYLKYSDYARSLAAASEVLKTNPENARAHALAGVAFLRSGYLRHAASELQLSIRLDSREPLAYGGAAEIHYYEGRISESRRNSIYAHKLDPDEPDYLVTYARASSRAEDFKEAADAYELFLQIAPLSDSERRDRIRGLILFYRRLSGLKVHQIAGAESTDLPFYLGSDRRPYLRVKLNGRDALFVLDTGSGFTVISREAAKKFGVSEIAKGGKSQGVGGTGKFPIVYGLISSLEIGAATVQRAPCFIRTFHGDVDGPPEERADGYLGLSILSHFLAELDYKEGKLRLDRGAGVSLPGVAQGATVVPFRTTQNGLISIETEVDGRHTINAILDSGASSTVISAAAVQRLNLHDSIVKGVTRSVVGAGGVTPNVRLLLLSNCRVADIEQRNLQALVMDFNAINETSGFEQSGILGGDFLRHFRITIDFNRGQLVFKRHNPLPSEQ